MNYHTSNINDKIKLLVDNEGFASKEPMKITDFIRENVSKYSKLPALAFEQSDQTWKTISYNEYLRNINQVAKAFIKIGLELRTSVGIIAFNCPEWFLSQFGAIFAGGICAGIYTTNTADATRHVLESSNARIVIVDDNKQMQKIKSIKNSLPKLKAVVQLHAPFDSMNNKEGFYKWSDIMEMNTDHLDNELEKIIDNITVNECCCLIYTSGTTGLPKGAMLCHDNFTFPVNYLIDNWAEHIAYGEEVFITYLPLNHIAAQIFDVFTPIALGGCVYFADRDALKFSLIRTLQKSRPTRFVGVPRVYEKFQEKLVAEELQLNWLKHYILKTAKNIIFNYHDSCMNGKPSSILRYQIAKNITSKIKINLGLDKCITFLTGAAPTAIETKKYFSSIDIKLTEVYGLSEAAGVTLSNLNPPNFETIGKPMPGSKYLIKYLNDSDYHGEICVKSRSIFMGYLNDLEKTNEVFDEDGYFHTGDLGYLDNDGYAYITGRLKEIIITAGGENIAPTSIENIIKNEIGIINNAFLVGDKRKYLTLLVTLKTVIDSDSGIPSDILQSESIEWLRNLNLHYIKTSGILEAGPCPKVLSAIQDGIDRYNAVAISNAQKIQKFTIVPKDFSIPTGELGPTLKLKRSFVTEKYADLINTMYN